MRAWGITAATLVLLTAGIVTAARQETQSSARATSTGDVLPFKATETTLANGLKIIVIPTGFPNLVSIQIPVQTGSRNEVEAGKSGFAHFFEHLMFRGTPKTPPERYRQIMSKAGARDNAGTGDDSTHYYSTFAKEDLETILATYADMFQNLAYSEADFKTEARAILGEYNKNSAEPLEKLLEVQRDTFFKVHTYKHTTMGFINDIENMPNEYEYSKVFFQRWYRPQYTSVVVAGDVAPDKVLPLIEKYWGGWKNGGAAPPAIPKEPAPKGPLYAHVPWPSETSPWVTVAFPGPAFDESAKDTAALSVIGDLYFGETSDLYKKLVVTEQKVDQLLADPPLSVDPSLFTVLARIKNPADAAYVRDQILGTFARARASRMSAQRVDDAKSYNRYSLARSIDSTERVAAVVARYVSFRRTYQTVNTFYRTLDSATPDDLQSAARKYFTDNGLIVTTLSNAPLAAGIERSPTLASFDVPASSAAESKPVTVASSPRPSAGSGLSIPLVLQRSVQPQLVVNMLFSVGSAHDPAGKEGLAALTAAMLSNAGSKAMTIDQIDKAMYPTAGSFDARADKEMTAFTASIHRDKWQTFVDVALPQLLEPGWRSEDFERLKTRQMNALVQDLRSNNEEELGKERLQIDIFRGTPYGHVALGTVAGVNAITLDDVKAFARQMLTRANLTLGVSGDASDDLIRDLQDRLRAGLPEGTATPRPAITVPPLTANHVDIIEKETRATAISFGFPIDVTRSHPDFAALSIVRSWLGEHRIASGQLYQRIREVRGINYGDYAYIEAFPRGMFQFFPDSNVARSHQIFEIWIRPVVPVNAHMTLRIATYELQKLLEHGLTREQFEETREYLMKNVYVMTARQAQQLGYALDSKWYGIGEFTDVMRKQLQALTVDQVNAAIKRHLAGKTTSIVIITKDAAGLKQALVSDAPSTIKYDGEKPASLLAEDRVIGSLKLSFNPSEVTITPVSEVFAK
ncbi:MAG TPA: pitrilysin family protein [Vicinamibacterales bacterium]|nr:pitrilysin family protein [Vicinamibacterales bacterium]